MSPRVPAGRPGLTARLILGFVAVAVLTGTLVAAAAVWGVETGMEHLHGPNGVLALLAWVVLPTALATAAAAALGAALGTRVVGPLRRLTSVVASMAGGDRAARVGRLDAASELAALAAAVDAMADALQRQAAARARVVSDVAHELRTPLAALQAALEELRDGLVEPDAAHLTALHDQSLRLGRVVEDLGVLASAEAAGGALRHDPVDLAELARDELRDSWPLLGAARVTTSCGLDGAPVRGDRGRLHQVLANLLDNVARYGGPGTTVTVTTSVQGEDAVLVVQDDGAGIPAEDLPHVTDRLYRGRNARDVAGSGIGLAVVRELVEAHGGRLAVTCGTDGRGTRVEVRLPRDPAAGESRPLGAGSARRPCRCDPYAPTG